jgi:succinate dehydrogenase / fumarate reductase flavoprotein subunit
MMAVQDLMQEKAGIARSDELLSEAHEELLALHSGLDSIGIGGNREFNPGWHTTLDLKSIFTVAEAVVLAARARKESRGAHSRMDHPDKDPEAGTYNNLVRKGSGGEMEIHREPIPEMRQELRDIIEEQG